MGRCRNLATGSCNRLSESGLQILGARAALLGEALRILRDVEVQELVNQYAGACRRISIWVEVQVVVIACTARDLIYCIH